MNLYAIFKIGGELFKVYDCGDDWQVNYTKGSTTKERWFTNHTFILTTSQSFDTVIDKLLTGTQYDRADIEWIK